MILWSRCFPFYQMNVAKVGHFVAVCATVWFNSLQAQAQQETPDLPNFHSVHNYLLRGGQPSANGLKTLKNMGVDTIIDLRAPTKITQKEATEAGELGIKYENLPMSDKAPTEKQVKAFLDTVDEHAQLAKNSAPTEAKYPHSVFVHCAHGSDRTGCMIGIWRVARDHWSYPQTYKEMRKYYFGPQYTKLSSAVKERASNK